MLTKLHDRLYGESRLPPEPTVEIPVATFAAVMDLARQGLESREWANESDVLLYQAQLDYAETFMEE